MAQQTAEWVVDLSNPNADKITSDSTTNVSISNKQSMTAVERLADYVRARYQANESFEHLVTNLIYREKEQRIKAYNIGYEDGQCNHINDAENYINESEYIHSAIQSEELTTDGREAISQYISASRI